ETSFSIMVVSIGFGCFIWQTIESGSMLFKIRKPVHAVVFSQALLGVIVTFVTLLTSLIEVDCTFRLFFSVVGVNLADIALQSILLWKAFLGNSRSKIILILGTIPLLGLVAFICMNITFGKSTSFFENGACATDYPIFIVIIKATLDFCSNTFLSACFLLVIYRHYRLLGSILGGSTPVIYTIDWYVASYLIIKQLKNGRKAKKEEDMEFDEDDMKTSHFTNEDQSQIEPCYY
ncbi:uncharacterized protein BX664DRAFT_239910, partial [Halteromyces radiatus]|uniref:uncharacterized protein n=1 Tax=Halteromyces radiatus TaxID=101107 RepID=UPI00221F75A0